MTLFEGQKNQEYEIRTLFVEEKITRRLQALGFNDGTRLRILNRKKNGSMIVAVKGTRLAIGRYLSSGIEVVHIEEGKDHA